MAEILIIDDDIALNATLRKVIERLGHTVASAHTLKEGTQLALSGQYDVVVLDVQLPDGNGLESLPAIQEAPSKPQVIISTAYGDQNGAELAIRNGAWDYIRKPASIDELSLPLMRALEFRKHRTAHRLLSLKREDIIGNSKQIREVLDVVAQAADSSANVLISGETGTGKELFARTIHINSDRADKNFVVVDCAAIPESLVESILFGYEKGAFTGAESSKGGLVEQADGGTLFLDEVGELPLSIQKSFLRVLQEHRFNPIGSKQVQNSDFRLIAATNRDLSQMVDNGQFRKDFLFRINSFSITLPSLRERKEDIRDLVIHFNNRFCEQYGLKLKGISPEFFKAVELYDFPGNIRELVNTMERVIVVARDEPTILHYHLPTHIRVKMAQSSFEADTPPGLSAPDTDLNVDTVDDFPPYDQYVESCSEHYFRRLASLVQGRRNDICRISGLSRTKAYRILKKIGL